MTSVSPALSEQQDKQKTLRSHWKKNKQPTSWLDKQMVMEAQNVAADAKSLPLSSQQPQMARLCAWQYPTVDGRLWRGIVAAIRSLDIFHMVGL